MHRPFPAIAERPEGAGLIWLVPALLFPAITAVWFAFDTRQPTMDEAGHILMAFSYQDLLQHARPFSFAWWQKFISVNQFYPYAVYLSNGILKLIFGGGRWVDVLSLVLFDFVLTASTFAITFQLTGRKLGAAFAAAVVNFIPWITFLGHTFLLDFQLVCSVSLGLAALLWWDRKPSGVRTAATCFVLAFAVMTKQVAAAFLLGMGLWMFVRSVREKDAKVRMWRCLALVLMVVYVAAFLVPWLISSSKFISTFARANQESISYTIGQITVPQAFVRGVKFYAVSLWRTMAPLLIAAFLLSLMTSGKKVHRQLLPLTLSLVGGILLISFLPWQFPHDRYVGSLLILPSVYIGVAAADALESPQILKGLLSAVFLSLAFLQYLSYLFAPYPVSASPGFTALSKVLGVTNRSDLTFLFDKNIPRPASVDWGQRWVLEKIAEVDPNLPVWLNVLSNHVDLNPQTIELEGKYLKSVVRPTSSRVWTVMGDRVSFTPVSAMYFHWYLLKTGDSGCPFIDKQSEDSYRSIIEFVQTSGKFREVARREIPDGTEIILYRQK